MYSILSAEALRTAELPDAGIISHPGFLESGKFISQVYGTSGLLFNYGDTGAGPMGSSPAAAWMARETKSGNLRDLILPAFQALSPDQGGSKIALTAFWFPSAEEVSESELPLHFQGSGHSPIAVHRTGFEKNDLFLGIKAGKAEVNHGHMDAGSFVIDWAGERWASELGSQSYHPLEETGIALFDMTQKSGRWNVFRLNNFSHNTLTYNRRIHEMKGVAEILSSEGPPVNSTVLDMAPPLGLPAVASAKRHFAMNQDRNTVTIVDELEGLKPGDTITWNLMTRARASAREGGFDLVVGGKRMALELSSPQSSSASAAPADPPPADFDKPNPGMTQITLDAVAGKDGRIRIEAIFRADP
jgi:hypothetical protein